MHHFAVYGGGVSEIGYLDELSRLIGQYSYINVSRSHSNTGPHSHGRRTKTRSSPWLT